MDWMDEGGWYYRYSRRFHFDGELHATDTEKTMFKARLAEDDGNHAVCFRRSLRAVLRLTVERVRRIHGRDAASSASTTRRSERSRR